jgi:hypothetical protein
MRVTSQMIVRVRAALCKRRMVAVGQETYGGWCMAKRRMVDGGQNLSK